MPGLGTACSYRGYYEDLAFAASGTMSAADCLCAALSAVDREFDGYRGGEYRMGVDTLCWFATEGESGEPLTADWLCQP